MSMRGTLATRFWAKVVKAEPDDCWLWTASVNRHGYGQIAVEKGRPVHAHRVALIVTGVEVPAGAHVHHRCEQRLCVNPGHLEVVESQREHSQRHRRGCARHGDAELVIQRSGKHKGRRYCNACNRERGSVRSRRQAAATYPGAPAMSQEAFDLPAQQKRPDPEPPLTPRLPEPRDHARVLRRAQALDRRVTILTRIKDMPNVAGKVQEVATTDAYVVVGGTSIPLDKVIRVVSRPPRKVLPR